MEDPLALRLHRIGQHANAAIRRGDTLNPRTILAICQGKKA